MASSFQASLVAGVLAAAASLSAPDGAEAAAAAGTREAATPDKARFVYTALGDSSGVGVGARGGGYVAHLFSAIAASERALPAPRLINLCRSGASSSGVLADQVPRVAAADRGLVTIGIGVNDLSRQVPVAQFGERLEAIAKGVRARTKVPVVISNLPDVSLAPVLPPLMRAVVAEQVLRYNAVIADLATRHQFVLADIHSASQREIPNHPEFFSPDGFHPSDAGYRFWANAIWPRIDGMLRQTKP